VTLIRVILKAILCLSLMTTRKTGERPHVVAVLLLLDYEVLHCNINNLRKRTPSEVILNHSQLCFAICNSHSWLHHPRTLSTSASLVEKCPVNCLANRSPRLLVSLNHIPTPILSWTNTNRLPHQEAHIGEDREPLSGSNIPRVSNVNHNCSCAPSTGPTEFWPFDSRGATG
jgi:hypothetical protein